MSKANIKTAALIITTIVALSGWGTIFYEWFTSTPKIQGKILGLLVGEIHIHPKFNEPKTMILPYLYLANTRKNPVHILDYKLYFDIGNGYEQALRVYGTKTLPQPSFSQGHFEITIPDFSEKLIYSKNIALRYGIPLHGFALFLTDKPHTKIAKNLKKIKIICIDAFDNLHEITYVRNTNRFNINLLQDIAGIDIKKKSSSNVDNQDTSPTDSMEISIHKK